MASLNDIATVTVSTTSVPIQQAGFGIPLIADYHTKNVDRARTYTSLSGMVTDNFATTDSAYLAAAAAFAQNPAPAKIVVGRRANSPTLRCVVTPNAANSTVYKLNVLSVAGVETEVSYTSDGTATAAEIATGLKVAIDALSAGLTVTDNTGSITIVATTSTNFFGIELVDAQLNLMKIAWTHADPGIAADLAAILLVDSSWYGVTLTSCGEAEIAAAAAWVESNKKLMIQHTPETDCANVTESGGASDVGHDLKASLYYRTALIMHPSSYSMAGAAMIAGMAYDPGSMTFKFKTLRGILTVPWTSTQLTNLKARNMNFMTDYAGYSFVSEGKVSGGEWIDFIRDRDWFESRLQTETVIALAGAKKIPFTDKGAGVVEGKVRAVIREAQLAGFLSDDPDSVTVVIPKVADVSGANKTLRKLAPITFQATAAGAIHEVAITGTVSI